MSYTTVTANKNYPKFLNDKLLWAKARPAS